MKIRKAVASDIDAIVSLLCRVFDDDPITNWFVRQDHKRQDAIRTFFDICVRILTIKHGEVLVAVDDSGVIRGAALWTPPGCWHTGLSQQVKLIDGMFRLAGLKKIWPVVCGSSKLESLHPVKPHFYLAFIGVERELQGTGIGGLLMKPVLDRCDSMGVGAYLENSKPVNREFYQHRQFVITRDIQLCAGFPNPPYDAMWREPVVAQK